MSMCSADNNNRTNLHTQHRVLAFEARLHHRATAVVIRDRLWPLHYVCHERGRGLDTRPSRARFAHRMCPCALRSPHRPAIVRPHTSSRHARQSFLLFLSSLKATRYAFGRGGSGLRLREKRGERLLAEQIQKGKGLNQLPRKEQLMSAIETSRGRRLDISPPPPGTWQELDEKAETYNKLVRERKVTGTRLGGLRGELGRAIAEDRDALARAIKEGKPDPKTSRVEKIEKEIKACERRLGALEEAIDLALEELIEVVDEHRDEWSQQAMEDVAQAQAEYGEAVEAVSSAVQEVLVKVALLRFTRLFPDSETSFKVRASVVPALRGQNGDPYSIYDVLAALTEDAQVKYDPKAWGSRDPLAVAIQARHDEALANQKKGLGYFTDEDLALLGSNPVQFFHGANARLVTPQGSRATANNTDEAEEDDDGE